MDEDRCAACGEAFADDQDSRECHRCHKLFCDECSFTAHDTQDLIGVNDVDWCKSCWQRACDIADAAVDMWLDSRKGER